MPEATRIRILEADNNRRGDLFGRLMADLFVALGYEQARLNIHKSGRELDLSAEHRLESRRAVAECKATAEPIGGDEVNKFVGALDAESKGKGKGKKGITGYFISLSGFKETAVEQEKQGRRTKIILLAGPQVVDELVDGRALIAKTQATELAGRCRPDLPHLRLDSEAELLAHERGWIWAIYYTQGKARTHFALIHSDGTPLARAVAEEVIASDHACRGKLQEFTCLNPGPPPGTDRDPRLVDALAAYGQYLASECGYIQLDGLPADSDVGSRRLRLENLFVPLHLDVTLEAGGETRQLKRWTVGAVLDEHSRLALLASPGGGKSTLLKRLAVAFADPARKEQIDDDLPKRDWLPLFFRCRELRDLARGSFADLLESLSQREPVRQYAEVFRAQVDRVLLEGRVLLLVDGLDEISDPGDRAAFVCTLRSALQAYPNTAFVVTSREAGFRHVAAHLAPICTRAVLSPFDAEDIRRLSVAWHREVVGDSEKVRTDAEQLAETISRNDRIQRLAVNPLLLTTLLLVKRWVGSLPTRRVVLYGKAVEVLLMTWNTEGHEPIPEEEALPQLCYVASAMMLEGKQKISRPRLAALLQDARDALPMELGYVRGTVDQFIHRVEDRSSLLMMSGHDVEDGRLVEFFEFRHLTFQEFLTARAMVEGWHPGRQESDTLASVLESHFEDEAWREVIPLAAVLGGKATEALIRKLTENIREPTTHRRSESGPSHQTVRVLAYCLADEAAARPETIREAVRELVHAGLALEEMDATIAILVKGRYGIDFCDEAREALQMGGDYGASATPSYIAVWWKTVGSEGSTGFGAAAEQFLAMLLAPSATLRCEGALGTGRLCAELKRDELLACTGALRRANPLLVCMLEGSDMECFTASFALAGLAGARVIPIDFNSLAVLFGAWQKSTNAAVRFQAARALAAYPLASRDALLPSAIQRSEVEKLVHSYMKLPDAEKAATLVLAWYLHCLDEENIGTLARRLLEIPAPDLFLRPTLEQLVRNVRPGTDSPAGKGRRASARRKRNRAAESS